MTRLRAKGYALFVVLTLLTLFFILTTAFSVSLQLGARQARTIQAESQALAAADSGIQYAMEAVRGGLTLPASAPDARWDQLVNENNAAVCFKVFSETGCDPGRLCVKSYGEVVRGGRCGDFSSDVNQVLGSRAVEAAIDVTQQNLAWWREANFP